MAKVPRCVVEAGDGLLARAQGRVVHVRSDDDALALEWLAALTPHLGSWAALVREAASRVAAAGYAGDPTVVMIDLEGEHTSAFVHGPVSVAVDLPQGSVQLDGASAARWVERELPWAATGVCIGIASPADDPTLPLDASGGVRIAAAQVFPSPVVGPGQVAAVHCADAHANPPDATVCRVCGVGLSVPAAVSVVERPVLGVLAFDDGRSIELRQPCLLGRRPPAECVIDGEPALSVMIDDDHHHVSQRHLELRMVGWEVHAVDLGSTNGTLHRSISTNRVTRLSPGQPAVLGAGDQLLLGRRLLTFH